MLITPNSIPYGSQGGAFFIPVLKMRSPHQPGNVSAVRETAGCGEGENSGVEAGAAAKELDYKT